MTTLPQTDPSWTVELQFAEAGEPLHASFEYQALIGRATPENPNFEGVDLTPYGGHTKGVSRRHAMLRWDGDQMTLQDLGTENGTFHNNTRLVANIAYPINTGDTIKFGNLECTITINHDLGRTAVVSARDTFEMQAVEFQPSGQSILIVEDDPAITKLYEVMLKREGYSTDVCVDVVSAIRLFTQKPPSLIILDLKLTGVHGLELCRYIRRDALHPNLPIVVVSAMHGQEMVKESMAAGADVFLSKPVNYRELLSIIGSLILHAEVGNRVMGTKQIARDELPKSLTTPPREDALTVYVDSRREPLVITVPQIVTLGRYNPLNTDGTHVNLDAFGGFEKGVSRVHARIRRINKHFQISDNDSTNGTFLNGERLPKEQWFNLKSGDELHFGTLKMNVMVAGE
jgi:CheY-like chemotaxis protein/pSer/pThr/pTyr-binding forkhead associated (FHA) protein